MRFITQLVSLNSYQTLSLPQLWLQHAACTPTPGHLHRLFPVPGLLGPPFFTCSTPLDLHISASFSAKKPPLAFPQTKPHYQTLSYYQGFFFCLRTGSSCNLTRDPLCAGSPLYARNPLTFPSWRGGVSFPLKLGWP